MASVRLPAPRSLRLRQPLLWVLEFPARLALGGGKPLAHELGTVHVSFREAQLAPVRPLQMRGLREDEQLVDDPYRAEARQSQRYAEAHRRAEIDDFLRRDRATVAQQSVGPPHLVLGLDAGVADQALARP